MKPIFPWSPAASVVGKPRGLRIMEKLCGEIERGFPPADMMLLSVRQAHFHSVENHFSIISLGIGKETCNDCSIKDVSRNGGLTTEFCCFGVCSRYQKYHLKS